MIEFLSGLVFQSDQGTEFKNAEMLSLLNDQVNTTWRNIASPFKLNRAIRSLDNLVGARSETSKTFSLAKDLQTVIATYNQRFHSSLQMSPKQALTNFDEKLPWAGQKEFNYDKNKEIVDKKGEIFQKQWPLLTPIRLVTKKGEFEKFAARDMYTREVFIIASYHRPLLGTGGWGFRIFDSSNELLGGVIYPHEVGLTISLGSLQHPVCVCLYAY